MSKKEILVFGGVNLGHTRVDLHMTDFFIKVNIERGGVDSTTQSSSVVQKIVGKEIDLSFNECFKLKELLWIDIQDGQVRAQCHGLSRP